MSDYRDRARQQFGEANGWRVSREFGLDVLVRRGVHDRGAFSYLKHSIRPAFDHAEFFHQDRYAIAIAGHNYDGDGTGAIDAAQRYGLIFHQAPAGKAASWYYPGVTTLLVLTRPDVEIVWPTPEQMAEFARDHEIERESREALDRAR